MDKQDRSGTNSRREFFKQLALSAGAVGAAGSGLAAAPAEAAEKAGGADTGSRYRLTEHVKTYYDLSKAF